MDIEIGTRVIETEGFFAGTEFIITGEYRGHCEKYGERPLRNPRVWGPRVPEAVAKIVLKRYSTTEYILAGSFPLLSEDAKALFDELLTNPQAAKSVRVHAPGRFEQVVRDFFDNNFIDYPLHWRGTIFGKNGGCEEQRSVAATITLIDGRKIHNVGLALRLLTEGKIYGWRITESV
jgi:hypothetical protein